MALGELTEQLSKASELLRDPDQLLSALLNAPEWLLGAPEQLSNASELLLGAHDGSRLAKTGKLQQCPTSSSKPRSPLRKFEEI